LEPIVSRIVLSSASIVSVIHKLAILQFDLGVLIITAQNAATRPVDDNPNYGQRYNDHNHKRNGGQRAQCPTALRSLTNQSGMPAFLSMHHCQEKSRASAPPISPPLTSFAMSNGDAGP
jgi:hypothetical protein